MQFSYRIHDLTKVISPRMIVYRGDPRPQFEAYSKIEVNGVNVTKLVLGSHSGTHIDAQWHFLQDGRRVHDEPLSKFIGAAVILDMSDRPSGEGIIGDDLERAGANKDSILLIYTGTGNLQTDFSYLEVSAAEWIVNRGVKCVGTDALSVEKYGSKNAAVHKILLSNDIGIIENLDSSLRQFAGKTMFLVCLPLPLEGVDGSPARAVLFEMIK